METERKIFSGIERLPEFSRDLKKLRKKFQSLEDDLETFQKTALKAFHKLGQENLGIVQIPDLGFPSPKVYKARKFACKALKGRGAASGLRVIYSYDEKQDKITYIEIYFKADQPNEDRDRLKRHFTELNKHREK